MLTWVLCAGEHGVDSEKLGTAKFRMVMPESWCKRKTSIVYPKTVNFKPI